MTGTEVALLQLGILVFAIMLGFPVAYTLMALGVGFGYYAYYDPALFERVYLRLLGPGDHSWIAEAWAYIRTLFSNRIFDLFVNQTYSVMSNDVLTSIPLFLFMGYVLERANIVSRLFVSLQVATRRIPGSLAVAAMVTCTLFGIASGIVGAVVTLMGLLALPSMLKARYDHAFATGALCAGGTLGILIPPSVMLIVYGATAGVSVVRLYAGAMIPGFLLAGLYVLYIILRAWWNPKLAPPPPEDESGGVGTMQVLWMLATSFVPLAVLIVVTLGAILFGIATPTESAAIGAVGGIILAAAYRALTWERLQESVYLTVRATAMVCWLFVGSSTFASVFAYLGGQEMIGDFVKGLDLTPLQFLLLAQVIIFLLGWPLEWTEIIIIFVPIFLPLLAHFQIDPLFFGILIALNLQTAFLSPPVAMSAFYLKGVSPPGVELTQIFRGSMPYMLIVVLAMVMIYVFPATIYWLPSVVYGR